MVTGHWGYLGVLSRRCFPVWAPHVGAHSSQKKDITSWFFWENAPRQQAWSCWWAVICCPAEQLLGNFMFLLDFFSLCRENTGLHRGVFALINVLYSPECLRGSDDQEHPAEAQWEVCVHGEDRGGQCGLCCRAHCERWGHIPALLLSHLILC